VTRTGLQHVDRVEPERIEAAVARLVGRDDPHAVRRFIANAPDHGIDLTLFWGTGEPLREVCLAVPGAGRTAMLFVGPPAGDHGEELAACVAAARAHMCGEHGAALVQALPEPHERHAIAAFERAGLTKLGDLAYLRRPFSKPAPARHAWPEGVRAASVSALGGLDAAHGDLSLALERSYEATLDCPGLCGMRELSDVLESHRAVGRWGPELWWVIYLDEQPEGCLLLNHCPELRSVELVYLGLSPALRGRGVGLAAMTNGIVRAASCRAGEMTCAVDRNNVPALRLYARLGFTEFASRVAFVGGA